MKPERAKADKQLRGEGTPGGDTFMSKGPGVTHEGPGRQSAERGDTL